MQITKIVSVTKNFAFAYTTFFAVHIHSLPVTMSVCFLFFLIATIRVKWCLYSSCNVLAFVHSHLKFFCIYAAIFPIFLLGQGFWGCNRRFFETVFFRLFNFCTLCRCHHTEASFHFTYILSRSLFLSLSLSVCVCHSSSLLVLRMVWDSFPLLRLQLRWWWKKRLLSS